MTPYWQPAFTDANGDTPIGQLNWLRGRSDSYVTGGYCPLCITAPHYYVSLHCTSANCIHSCLTGGGWRAWLGGASDVSHVTCVK